MGNKTGKKLILFYYFRVTRTLYAFGEQTNMDPSYTGPEFNPEKILRDLITQVSRLITSYTGPEFNLEKKY